jgi:hypothetical protein
MLARLPEVDLHPERAPAKSAKGTRKQIDQRAKAIHEQNAKDPDAFVRHLEATRPDLAGLAFLKGKDCKLSEGHAKDWDALSFGLRGGVGSVDPMDSRVVKRMFAHSSDPLRSWSSKLPSHVRMALDTERAIAALHHVFHAHNKCFRLALVRFLEKDKSRIATEALARLAVFDLDPQVRRWALDALKHRPAAEYAEVLLGSLRYPWEPVAQRASEAFATLRPKGITTQLVALLEEPEPDAPFLARQSGKEVLVRRELVRINHLRNCLLCHAPSFDDKDPVRGLIPIPGQQIPIGYCFLPREGAFVRADVTYLRQDFSVMLPVADSHPWPKYQRYDVLVRLRPLTQVERAACEARKPGTNPPPLSDHRRALLSALQALTGENAGPTASQWRQRLGARAAVAAPPLR